MNAGLCHRRDSYALKHGWSQASDGYTEGYQAGIRLAKKEADQGRMNPMAYAAAPVLPAAIPGASAAAPYAQAQSYGRQPLLPMTI